MKQSIQTIIGDYRAFFAEQKAALAGMDIAVSGFPISHLAFRTPTRAEYLETREALEAHCRANVENVWNGRAISKLLLAEPLELEPGVSFSLIELIPPAHQNEYRMGLEHVGFVVGAGLEDFARQHADKFTGRQYQSEVCQPYFIRFTNRTTVKFYQHSLHDVVVLEGRRFDGFHHAW